MASCIAFSQILLGSFSPKPSQLHIPQKTQFPFLSQSSSLSLQTRPSESKQGGPAPILGSYNVQIVVEENEPEEKLLSRFRREVFRAGIILECKRRRFFENPHDKKKRKSREAAKRNRRSFFPLEHIDWRPQFKSSTEEKEVANKKKQEYDLDDDNWDLPEDS